MSSDGLKLTKVFQKMSPESWFGGENVFYDKIKSRAFLLN